MMLCHRIIRMTIMAGTQWRLFHLPPPGALSLAAEDVRTPFAAAAAIAAYLGVYLLGSPSASPASAGSAAAAGKLGCLPVPPPIDLVSPGRLGAVLRLLQYRPGGPGPMLEALEGVPCRWGWGHQIIQKYMCCMYIYMCVCIRLA